VSGLFLFVSLRLQLPAFFHDQTVAVERNNEEEGREKKTASSSSKREKTR